MWVVTVGNIGTVYDGPNEFTARQAYNTYVGHSRRDYVCAGGEPVSLFRDDEIVAEHSPQTGEDS